MLRIIIFALAAVAAIAAARAEKRALVVGVNVYDNLPNNQQLQKAVNDSRAVGKTFEQLGFKVEKVENVDRRSFNEAWSQFISHLEPRDIAVFQFSGHGIELDGANYLVMRDVPRPKANAKSLMIRESVAVDSLLRELQERGPQVSLLILDACRNNPFEEGGKKAFGGERGLARIDPPRGTFVMMSAGTRQMALDRLSDTDGDPNSVYTRNLLPLLVKPGLSLTDVAQDVRDGVLALAGSVEHEQTPAYYDQLTAKFYLAGEGKAGGGADPEEETRREWSSVDKNSLPELETFTKRHPSSRYTDYARARITAMAAPLPMPQMEKPAKPVVGVFEPKVGETFRDCPDCPEMVVVPSGSFTMGSPESEPERRSHEGPQHRVTIAKPFAVGKYAVTVDQFKAFARETGHKTDGGCSVFDGNHWMPDSGKSFLSPGFTQDGSHPVVCVDWEEAQAYVTWLSKKTGKTYRLPSEAEREYFTRAETTTPFWWGSSITPDQANYEGSVDPYKGGGRKGEYRQKTVPVGSFKPNPWGLYQVHGNALEWTEDCWNVDYNDAPTDGSAHKNENCFVHVLRGGSWLYGPGALRSADRHVGYNQTYISGFRLARTL